MIRRGLAGLVLPVVALFGVALPEMALSVVNSAGQLPVVDLRRDWRRAAIEIDSGGGMDGSRHRRPANTQRRGEQQDSDDSID